MFMGHTFKCFYCQQYYPNVDSLLTHTDTHKILDKNTLLQQYITKHKRLLQVDISKLKCRICNQSLKDLNGSREHLTAQHNFTFFSSSNAMFEYHLEIQDGFYRCHVCNEKYHTFTLLNSHMNTHVAKVVCETCGTGFPHQRLLIKHQDVHNIVPYPCKDCDKIFARKAQLRYHVDFVHRKKMCKGTKKCPHCSFEFREHSTKMVHLRDVHGMSFNFNCHVCQASFSNRRAVTLHTTKFHSEKYKCDVCDKCFGMKCYLDRHKRGHTGERAYVCNICKNNFMHHLTLVKHIKKVHRTDSKFICPKCCAGFDVKTELDKHTKQWH